MKDILIGIGAIILGGFGCLIQIALWGIGIVLGLWVGFKVLNWIF